MITATTSVSLGSQATLKSCSRPDPKLAGCAAALPRCHCPDVLGAANRNAKLQHSGARLRTQRGGPLPTTALSFVSAPPNGLSSYAARDGELGAAILLVPHRGDHAPLALLIKIFFQLRSRMPCWALPYCLRLPAADAQILRSIDPTLATHFV